MKKIIIINELSGMSFGAQMEDPTSWIAEQVESNSWGLPERWELNPIEDRVLDTREVENLRVGEGEPTYHTEYLIKADYVITIEDITDSYKLSQLRAKRNVCLDSTDRIMLSDYPITTEQRASYVSYRQYLRDLPAVRPIVETPMTFAEFAAS